MRKNSEETKLKMAERQKATSLGMRSPRAGGTTRNPGDLPGNPLFLVTSGQFRPPTLHFELLITAICLKGVYEAIRSHKNIEIRTGPGP